MRLGKIACRHAGCIAYAEANISYCINHKKEQDQSNPIDEKRNKFLHTKRWKEIRRVKLLRNPMCEICLVEAAKDVHHLIARRENEMLESDINNLQALCKKCHSKITKKEMQKWK